MGKRELPRTSGGGRRHARAAGAGTDAPSGRKREKTGVRVVISRILIFGGLGLMAVAAVYELANYPWGIVFGKPEDFKEDTLPDPTPPPFASLIEYDPREDHDDGEETGAPELPGSETYAQFAAGADETVVCSVIGAVKIPKLGIFVNIMDGTTQTHLLLGAGHVRGTPLPGKRGNCSIAGHRVTARMHPFRHLDKMEAGDYVYVIYDGHKYLYETLSTFIVSNTEGWVMENDPSEEYMLTLITCHPVGSARQRLILRGRLTDVDGLAPEDFFAAQEAAQASSPPPEETAPPEELLPGETPPGETAAPPTASAGPGPDTETPSQTPAAPLIIGPDDDPPPITIPSDDGT